MLRPLRLFADMQSTQEERLRLGILTLLVVEISQIGERTGQLGEPLLLGNPVQLKVGNPPELEPKCFQ
jgi:hypothetical protein